MTDNNGINGKMLAGQGGLGTPNQEMVEERARELARIDGRDAANEADLILAKAELTGKIEPAQAPEIETATRDITEWDTPAGAAGQVAPKVGPDDETAIPQELVEEGIEEADHEQRLSASEGEEPA